MKLDKNAFIAIWIIIVLVVTGLIAWSLISHNAQPPITIPPAPTSTPTGTATTPGQASSTSYVTNLPSTELPVGIPSNFPMESGTLTPQNFETNYPGQAQQESVREYVIAKSPEVTYQAFQAYFKNNGWTVLATLDQPTDKVITASKFLTTANIEVSSNSATNQNTVTITMQYYPAYMNATSVPIIKYTPQ